MSDTFDRYRAARASVMLGFDCAPAPRDLEMVHGPWDERTASLMVILHRSNVARAMRPEGSTLVPAIGLPMHGPERGAFAFADDFAPRRTWTETQR
jgi:hypothetical protein